MTFTEKFIRLNLKINKLFQFGRYIIVGIAANVINFSIYYLLLELGIVIFYASFSGYFGGLVVSFVGARYWTFKTRLLKSMATHLYSFYKFIGVYCATGFAMSLIITFLEKLEPFDENISWAIGAAFAVVVNFLAQKHFIFRYSSNLNSMERET